MNPYKQGQTTYGTLEQIEHMLSYVALEIASDYPSQMSMKFRV